MKKWNSKNHEKNMKRFLAEINEKCKEKVNSELKRAIPLNRYELTLIYKALWNWARWEAKHYLPCIRYFAKDAKLDDFGYAMVEMDPRFQWVSVMAIEATGASKEEFEIMNRIIQWYGIERSRAKVFKEFIPEDPREGIYDDEYDGTGPDSYTLDNIGLSEEEKHRMEQAVVNNKFNKRNLVKT